MAVARIMIKKNKRQSASTTALLIWASILTSILVCIWNYSLSITLLSPSNDELDGWQNHPPLRSNPNPNSAVQLQLWYFPHMGHPWLEWMAAENNLIWGACYFEQSPLHAPWCPPLPNNSNVIHHEQDPPPPLPPHSQVLAWTWKNPDNPPPEPSFRKSSTSTSQAKHVVVIRNPYHRLIDLYFYLIERLDVSMLVGSEMSDSNSTALWNGPCRTPIHRLDQEYYTPVQLNSHLIKWLKKLRSSPCLQDCLLLPQYEYIHTFYKKQNKTAILVDHILHYEQLQDEWKVLANQYPTVLPPTMLKIPSSTSCRHNDSHALSVFTEHDFSPTTLALIHRIYAMDFVLGNYTQIPVKPYVWPDPNHHPAIESIKPISNNNHSIQHSIMPRLELIHIPKTGGTMLELWAASANVTWGACHFEVPWKWRKGSDLRHCPVDSVRDVNYYTDFPLWHAPRYMLPHHLPFDPYDNLQDDEMARRPPHYFVVIRNPYQRLISLFYMNYATFARNNMTKCMDSREKLNILLRQWFRLMLTGQSQKQQTASINPIVEPYDPDRVCHHACAFLPQSHYILPTNVLPPLSLRISKGDIGRMMTNTTAFLNRSSWLVHHMLHLEHLEEELESLLKLQYPDYHQMLFESGKEYHLGGGGSDGSRRTKKFVNANRCNTSLTAKDLDRETLKQIHSLYALDFVLGGYSMVPIKKESSHSTTSDST